MSIRANEIDMDNMFKTVLNGKAYNDAIYACIESTALFKTAADNKFGYLARINDRLIFIHVSTVDVKKIVNVIEIKFDDIAKTEFKKAVLDSAPLLFITTKINQKFKFHLYKTMAGFPSQNERVNSLINYINSL